MITAAELPALRAGPAATAVVNALAVTGRVPAPSWPLRGIAPGSRLLPGRCRVQTGHAPRPSAFLRIADAMPAAQAEERACEVFRSASRPAWRAR